MSNNYPHRRGSFVWPILFIGAGVYFLLVNLGYASPLSWEILSKLWPVLLIIIGLDILLGRRSLIGSAISSLIALVLIGGLLWLVLTGPQKLNLYGINLNLSSELNIKSRTIQEPLDDIKDTELHINWSSGRQVLYALPQDSVYLLDGDLTFYNDIDYDVYRNGSRAVIRINAIPSPQEWFSYKWQPTDWKIGLNPNVNYDLIFDIHSGQHEFDLKEIKLSRFKLDLGSGAVDMVLPDGEYTGIVDMGSGDLSITLPETSAVQVKLDQGSGNFRAPGMTQISAGKKDGGIWQTKEYDKAAQHIELDIDKGSGDIYIR